MTPLPASNDHRTDPEVAGCTSWDSARTAHPCRLCSMLPRTLFRPSPPSRQFSVSALQWNVHQGPRSNVSPRPGAFTSEETPGESGQPSTTPISQEGLRRDTTPSLESSQLKEDSPSSASSPSPSSSTSFSPLPSSSEPGSSPHSASSSSETPNAKQVAYAAELERVKAQAKEWSEKVLVLLRHRADDFTQKSKETFSHLGQHLNKVTGYEEIEALKKSVVAQEERINVARRSAREAKTTYEAAVIQRSNSQREVNDLLQRKSTWSDSDVSRFTSLVRQDHLYEQEEGRAKAAVDETEDAVEKEFSQLMRTILARYHEEQVWSDKIRSASTYGSLVALGLNMLVFITAIIFVEPWKRRRLAQTFETKVEGLSKGNEMALQEATVLIQERLDKQDGALMALREDVMQRLDVATASAVAAAAVVAGEQTQAREAQPVVAQQPAPTPSPPVSLTERYWEVGVVGGGAFVVGILGTLLFSR